MNKSYLQKIMSWDPMHFHLEIIREIIIYTDSFESMMKNEIMKELVLKLPFDHQYYKELYEKEFIYITSFKRVYNVDYFIQKISILPENLDETSAYNLLGEYKDENGVIQQSDELKSIESLVNKDYMSIYYILKGGGQFEKFGDTPKDRLLNSLKYLKNLWYNKLIVSGFWDEDSFSPWGNC